MINELLSVSFPRCELTNTPSQLWYTQSEQFYVPSNLAFQSQIKAKGKLKKDVVS